MARREPTASGRRNGPADATDAAVQAVRRFNRFYTQRIGILSASLLGSPFSLTEGRVLYEFAHRDLPTAGDLARDLGLDQGYMSRIVERFERRGLLRRTPSPSDARKRHLELTGAGKEALRRLDRASSAQVASMLAAVPEPARRRVLGAMRDIEAALGRPATPEEGWLLRPHRAGDLGWIVERHGALYAEERGWDQRFEGHVASIVADFAEHADPARERCWIAERGGNRVGSVLLAARSRTVARLRLLLVEPSARGRGIGRHLVRECLAFARQAGYRRIELSTEEGLESARRIYAEAGFRLRRRTAERKFGRPFAAQTWELELVPGPGRRALATGRGPAGPRVPRVRRSSAKSRSDSATTISP